ncbi:MAG: protein kinase [Rhodospirillales bacterium]|nr:protein kinase [Rhodospirillales bacterium]
MGDSLSAEQISWSLRVLRFAPNARLGDAIGRGQFGQAHWLVTDKGQKLPMVAKTANNVETAASLQHEAEYYDKIGPHPNIARCYGMQQIDGKDALVMEGIQGRNMSGTMDLLEKLRTGDAATVKKFGLKQQLSQSDFVGALQHITMEMLAGLAHLEEKGVVHNDIRADNVVIDQKTGEVKLIDLGNAQAAGIKPTGKFPVFTGSVSPDYATDAPLTGRHDMFALGEAARKPMEGDQFRYLTGKNAADLSRDDVASFADPGPGNAPKQALARRAAPTPRPEQVPSKLAARAGEIAESADKLLKDPYVGRAPAAGNLADAIETAAAIDTMEASEAAALVAAMEKDLKALVAMWPAYYGASYDPLAPAMDDARAKLGRLRADPAIARSETGQRLARREHELDMIGEATRRGGPATQLPEMQAKLGEDVARVATDAKATVVATEPVEKQIAALLGQPGVKGSPNEARLRALQRDQTLLQTFASAPDPTAAVQDHLRTIRQEIDAADTDLKRTGTYGAETDYTRFVNWLMHPDPTKRPSASALLKLVKQLDGMDAKQRKEALEKIDPIKPPTDSPTGEGAAAQGLPIRFLADRLGDASSMRQLLSSTLGQAATAEPPAPVQPLPAATQANGAPPTATPPPVQAMPGDGPARGARGKRRVLDIGAPEAPSAQPIPAPTGGSEKDARIDVGALEGKYTSPTGDSEGGGKTSGTPNVNSSRGPEIDVAALEGKYTSPEESKRDAGEKKKTPEPKPKPPAPRFDPGDDDEPKPPNYI